MPKLTCGVAPQRGPRCGPPTRGGVAAPPERRDLSEAGRRSSAIPTFDLDLNEILARTARQIVSVILFRLRVTAYRARRCHPPSWPRVRLAV